MQQNSVYNLLPIRVSRIGITVKGTYLWLQVVPESSRVLFYRAIIHFSIGFLLARPVYTNWRGQFQQVFVIRTRKKQNWSTLKTVGRLTALCLEKCRIRTHFVHDLWQVCCAGELRAACVIAPSAQIKKSCQLSEHSSKTILNYYFQSIPLWVRWWRPLNTKTQRERERYTFLSSTLRRFNRREIKKEISKNEKSVKWP